MQSWFIHAMEQLFSFEVTFEEMVLVTSDLVTVCDDTSPQGQKRLYEFVDTYIGCE